MGFFERVSNGISIGFHSIFFPIRQSRLYIYSLFQLILMSGGMYYLNRMMPMSTQFLISFIGTAFVYSFFYTGVCLGSVASIRTVINTYEERPLPGFFQSMYVSLLSLGYLFLIAFVSFFLSNFITYGPIKLYPILGYSCFFLGFLLAIAVPFFIPTLLYEYSTFSIMLKRSFMRFLNNIVLLLSTCLTYVFILSIFVLGMILSFALQFGPEVLANLQGKSEVEFLALFQDAWYLLVIYFVISWFVFTGSNVVIPTLYDYIVSEPSSFK